MIKEWKKTQKHAKLPAQLILEAAPFDIYLTGSRRMAQLYPHVEAVLVTENTDWDYVANDSQEIRTFLELNGFSTREFSSDADYEESPGKGDSWIRTTAVYFDSTGLVQVILKSNTPIYLTVFENIPIEAYVEFGWKQSAGTNSLTIKLFLETCALMVREGMRLNAPEN